VPEVELESAEQKDAAAEVLRHPERAVESGTSVAAPVPLDRQGDVLERAPRDLVADTAGGVELARARQCSEEDVELEVSRQRVVGGLGPRPPERSVFTREQLAV